MKYRVEFAGGESREYPGMAVDCMFADVEGIELYAELKAADDDDESANYLDLKAEIIRQAEENGIDRDNLVFWWD